MAVKIGIISGFLGAGKTTLIQKLLSESLAGEKVVLIENEFGEIGIDGKILEQSGIRVREINSGCICCTLAGDFTAALRDVIKKYQPERILIEPSGVAKLSDVLRACRKIALREDLRISFCAAVADVTKFRMYSKNFSEFFFDQIENAGTVLLSRTQRADAGLLAAAVWEIREHNPRAHLVTTPWDQLSGDEILSLTEKGVPALLSREKAEEEHHHDREHNHDHHGSDGHDADEVFEVWSAETPHVYPENELKATLRQLPKYGTVLRAKGIVPVAEGSWMQFDFVPEEVSGRAIAPDCTGRLCVIGRNLDRQGLEALFGV